MSIGAMIARAGMTLNHQRPTVSGERGGGRRQSWATLASAVACWKQPARSGIVERFAARQLVVSHVVYVAQDLAAQEGDRLVIGGTNHLVRGELDQAGLGRVWAYAVEEAR